jgi:ribosomal protein L37E
MTTMQWVNGRREFEVCVKCGEPDPAIRYRKDASSLDCPREHMGKGEHFHTECRRCGYRWVVWMVPKEADHG